MSFSREAAAGMESSLPSAGLRSQCRELLRFVLYKLGTCEPDTAPEKEAWDPYAKDQETGDVAQCGRDHPGSAPGAVRR